MRSEEHLNFAIFLPGGLRRLTPLNISLIGDMDRPKGLRSKIIRSLRQRRPNRCRAGLNME